MKQTTRIRVLMGFSLMLWISFGFQSPAYSATTLKDLDQAYAQQQWNDVIQSAYELIHHNPSLKQVRLKGAYALFQKGYSNSALLLLKPLNVSDWKNLPQGKDRLVEVISLFQKKVPVTVLPGRMEQLNVDETTTYYKNEIHFAKGRVAYEKSDIKGAIQHLNQIAPGSRYFGFARYLLAAIAIKQGNLKTAEQELSKVFEPSVFKESTEFWKDLKTQMTPHWGTNLSVMLDTDGLRQTAELGELALLGLARVSYGKKEFQIASDRYLKLPESSPLYPRAQIENLWSLLALNRHDEAQSRAAKLISKENIFESKEAMILRSLILVDAKRLEEARQQLNLFFKSYEETLRLLKRYQSSLAEADLPQFLSLDYKTNHQLNTLIEYQSQLTEEMTDLKSSENHLFPAFQKLAAELSPLVRQAQNRRALLIDRWIQQRLSDLDRLYVQGKLILAESYLEEREKLREEYQVLAQKGPIDENLQEQHDARLVKYLSLAIQHVDEAITKSKQTSPNLRFRQSELLWELGTAYSIIGQSKESKIEAQKGLNAKHKALELSESIVAKREHFKKEDQALFFVGYARLELEKTASGLEALRDFVKRYPAHTNVPDAYRILGDWEFDHNRFKAAELYYEKILKFTNSPIVGYALYKIGWCAYNLRDFAKNLLGLEKAVVWANHASQTQQLLTFKKEARRDLIAVYAEVGDHHSAYEYFNSFAKEEIESWLADLAKQLDTNGLYEKSSDIYKKLLELNPHSPQAMSYQTAMIQGAYKLRRWDQVLSLTLELRDRYASKLSTPPNSEDKGHPAFQVEKTLREVVLGNQFEARKSPSADETKRAIELDRLYLTVFDDWKSAQPVFYEHSHFLFQKKDYLEAGTVFRIHWNKFKTTLEEPLKEESLRNLIGALDKAKKETDDPSELFSLTKDYLTLYPKGKHTRQVASLRAALLLKNNKLIEGIQESQSLMDDNPTDDLAKAAFKNISAAYYELKDWDKTYTWASDLLSRSGYATYAPQLRTIKEEAAFLSAQHSAETIKDPKLSAEKYLKIARDPDMSRLRKKSYYNAFIQLQKSDQKIEALKVANELESHEVQYEGKSRMAGIRAAFYQEAGDYLKAYPLFQTFLRQPDSDVSTEALQQARYNTAIISEAIGEKKGAAFLYEELVKDKSTPSVLLEQAKRGLARLESTSRTANRVTAWSPWDQLLHQKLAFERHPLSNQADLAVKIRAGAVRLEKISKQLLDAASNSQTPTHFAFEAYCSVPFLYTAYAQAVLDLAKPKKKSGKVDEELLVELQKITLPLQAKADELAKLCLSRSTEAGHTGTYYWKVQETWGWLKNADLKAKAQALINGLKRASPWVDSASESVANLSEDEVIERHLAGKGNAESWYHLAKLRWDAKKYGLSWLTLIDLLAKKSDQGKVLNLLAALQETKEPSNESEKTLIPLYEAASRSGGSGHSEAVYGNLARFYLGQGKLDSARSALERFMKTDLLNGPLRELAGDFLKESTKESEARP